MLSVRRWGQAGPRSSLGNPRSPSALPSATQTSCGIEVGQTHFREASSNLFPEGTASIGGPWAAAGSAVAGCSACRAPCSAGRSRRAHCCSMPSSSTRPRPWLTPFYRDGSEARRASRLDRTGKPRCACSLLVMSIGVERFRRRPARSRPKRPVATDRGAFRLCSAPLDGSVADGA